MKNKPMEYKGYYANVTCDMKSKKLRGILRGIDDFVDFSAETAEELEQQFHMAVDDYLEFCQEVGKTPCTEWNETFRIRMNSSFQG